MKIKLLNDNSTLEIPEGEELSTAINSSNSSLLFGCRTGICGTCLVHIEEHDGKLSEKNSDEAELLEIIAEGNPKARLACKLKATCNMTLKQVDKK